MHGRRDARIIYYYNFVCALQKQNADDEYSNDEYVFSGQVAQFYQNIRFPMETEKNYTK